MNIQRLWFLKIKLILLVGTFWLPCVCAYAEPPRNIIFYIGDGMGFEQVEAAEIYTGSVMSFNNPALFPYRADCTTYSASSSVTDSAAAGTALATGNKVNNGVISMANPGNGAELRTLLEYFKAQGKAVGLITTAYLTHATPAAFGAHDPSRSSESAIAADYLTQTRPNVLFGGGSHGLTLDSTSAAGYTVTDSTAGFLAFAPDGNPATAEYFSAQFGTGYMPYKQDHLGETYPYPKLDDMVTKAIQILSEDPDGFFLMVEGGRIDHACHSNLIKECIHEVIDLSNAVQAGYDWASNRSDTLLLVTADHETGGLSVDDTVGDDGYPVASWTTTGHTSRNVPVYAWGINANRIAGPLDNTNLFKICTADNTQQNLNLLWATEGQTWKSPDFNGDGKTDILWYNVSTGAKFITLMDGDVRGPFLYIPDSKGFDLDIVGLADFNNDGKTDLFWELASTGANFITLMNGGIRGPFQYIPDSRGFDLDIIDLADFNGDGKADLLWELASTGANFITLMNDGIRGPFLYIPDSRGFDLGIVDMADFNGDGKTDLLWELASTGANFITLMNGGIRGPFQYIPDSRGFDLDIVDLADFNGDGKADLLWELASTGANFISLMNGGIRGSFQYIPDSRGFDLDITDLADFNGDGKADIVWEQASTGANLIMLMNGNSVVQSRNLGDNNTTLQIAGLADFNADNTVDIILRNGSFGYYSQGLITDLAYSQINSLGGSHSTLQIVTP